MDIQVDELYKKLKDGDDFVFVDVREPWENEEFALGAKLIPLGDLVNRLFELDSYKNSEVVVHCKSGGRSGVAKALLEGQGFTNVRNLIGGVLAWKDAYGNEVP
ncbi:MAG: rhodanese-like domain-containing protein [Saprospiraceae bacterium]